MKDFALDTLYNLPLEKKTYTKISLQRCVQHCLHARHTYWLPANAEDQAIT